MIEQDFKGMLLASHPKRLDSKLAEGVILIIDYSSRGSIGLQINKPILNSVGLEGIMENMGMGLTCPAPLYEGGSISTNRINLIHSLDWASATTKKITDKIGVTSDISVLSALSLNQGPEYFRACVGCVLWEPNQLDIEIQGMPDIPIGNTWSYMPSNLEIVFEEDGPIQWHQVITESSKLRIASWF